MAPIPECIKTTWNGGSRASLASLDSHNTESDLDYLQDDDSNIIPDNQLLKRKQVVFSDNLTTPGAERNNAAVSPGGVVIEDLFTENKAPTTPRR